MTLVEVMAGTVLLVFGALSLIRALVQTTELTRANRETAAALRAVEIQLETMKGEGFSDLYARYNETDEDDPAGAPGPTFDVSGLLAGDEGFVGTVELPGEWDNFGNLELREDAVDPTFGLPRDLNGDGVIDDLNHAGDYVLLPMRVRVAWESMGAESEVVVHTMVRGS